MSEPRRIQPPVAGRTTLARATGATLEERNKFADLLHQRAAHGAVPDSSAMDAEGRPEPGDAAVPHPPQDLASQPDHDHHDEPEAEPPSTSSDLKTTAPGQPATNEPGRHAPANEHSAESHERTERPTRADAAAVNATRMSPEGRAVVARIADTVTSFCNDPAVVANEDWQVRMELHPDVLPATTLGLIVSPHLLSLRFEARDERSKLLISRHQSELTRRLENSLATRREISIDIDPPASP